MTPSKNPSTSTNVYAVDKLISEARRIAADYRRATGKSLAISGEIATHDACSQLNLEAVEEQGAGYDAIGRGEREGLRIQIKGRAIFDEAKKGQRIGQIKLDQDWDCIILVLMDDNFESDSMYEANRVEIMAALDDAADSSRTKRGAMSVARFKNIARQVWNRDEGTLHDELWDNQS
ncbi:MAG: hypothetical protein OEY00_08505 [Gammaproteobacteria bacterium]|nr:hypothetical protein [Gammaproteobacteria bacterium]